MFNKTILQRIVAGLLSLGLLAGCNLPQATPPTPEIVVVNPDTPVPAETAPPETTVPESTSTPGHQSMPGEIEPGGAIFYDVDSSGPGPEHRAPYGEFYPFNRFERPFTQADMTYIANLDIVTFQMTEDAEWHYAFLKLVGGDPNDSLQINFGVEIDQDRDGFGDILIWARPPYTTTWQTENVQVFLDKNQDTGGRNSSASEAPLKGDGYETLEFDRGTGSDPDLAWVRINPNNSAILEFAFKRSLSGNDFMWNPWADAGLKDPSQFNYNDRMTIEEAGASVRENPFYPIKGLYALDNSCRANYGFSASGTEPLLCFLTQPTPTRRPGEEAPPAPGLPGTTPVPPPPQGCQPPPGGCPWGWAGEPFCYCIPG